MNFAWCRMVILGVLGVVFATGCLAHHRGPLAGEPSDASFVELEDTRIRYVDTADDPGSDANATRPVAVLVHGFASSLNVWDGVLEELEKTHRVVALDLKGFGWSGRPPGDYSPEAQARIVLGLLDELEVESFSLVAHSWGASVALKVAMLEPQRVTKLALYDAWVYEEQLPTFFVWSRAPILGEVLFTLFYHERPADKVEVAFYDPGRLDEAFIDHTREMLNRPGTAAAALEAVRGQEYGRYEDAYSKIQQPTLLLWGREDRVTRLDAGVRLSRQLPNSQLIVYPQCGHFPMIEARDESTRDLATFLNDTPPTERQALEASYDSKTTASESQGEVRR